MAADNTTKAAQRKTVTATLSPVKAAAPTVAADSNAGKPSKEQVALWKSLSEDQKLALREREAVRIFSQGLEQHRDGNLEEAARLYGQAIQLNQNFPDIYNNLGVALRALGKREASAACYQRSLALKPDHAGAYTNLGNVLRELGRLEVAAASHRRAVELDPGSADAHYNLGLALRDLGETEAALKCFDETLALNPDHPAYHWDRSLSLLQGGDLVNGFTEYEWRLQLASFPKRDFAQPRWDGADLRGKTILLHQEQGFGDLIHFARYIPILKAMGGNVVVEVHPELSRLFSTIDGVGQVVNRGADLPKFDVYLPIMSLSHVLGTAMDSIPADVPYLKAPDGHARHLPANLGSEKKIGIAWAGRPTHKNDAKRSVSFSHFVELMGVADTALYSLQFGPASKDIAENGCEALIMDLGTKMQDFADTAAVITELDLVITVDTSIAHLAGALGKPVWVALPFPGDWRWMLDRDDSPWYPTARLFRQPKPGDWETVFGNIRAALAEEAKS